MIIQFDKNTLLGCFFLFQNLYKVFVQFLGTSYFLLTDIMHVQLVLVLQA